MPFDADSIVTSEQIDQYRRDGFVVVDNVLSQDEVKKMRQVTDALVEASRNIKQHDDIYDLEPSHSADQPRVRRIKQPHLLDPAFASLVRHPKIVKVLQKLMYPSIRFDVSKLNLRQLAMALRWSGIKTGLFIPIQMMI